MLHVVVSIFPGTLISKLGYMSWNCVGMHVSFILLNVQFVFLLPQKALKYIHEMLSTSAFWLMIKQDKLCET